MIVDYFRLSLTTNEIRMMGETAFALLYTEENIVVYTIVRWMTFV
jgi:hypothetical protein